MTGVAEEGVAARARLASLDLGGWRAPRRRTPPRHEVAWCVPGVALPPRPPVPSLELLALREAVDACAATGASGRAVDLAEVLVLAERVRGLGLRELGELDACGGYRDDGAQTAAAWLTRNRVVGGDTARAAVRLAARLREELAEFGAALTAGMTTLEHVRAVSAGTTGLDPDLVRQAQGALRELTTVAEPAVVRRQLRERAEAIDPQPGRDAARRQRARRGFYADPLAGAGVVLGGALDDEDGAVLLHGLDLEVEAGRTADDTRSLPARRADVLVGWARRAAREVAGPDTGAQDAHTVRTHLLVTCTAQQLAALAGEQAHDQLDALALLTGCLPTRPPVLPTGAPLLPHALVRMACDAALSLVVHPQDRPASPLYVGRSSRTITGAQFKALVVRDRHCVVGGCRRRPALCEAHHVLHWLHGGPTDLDNLVLLCHVHHHEHHDGGHELQHRDGRWLTARGWRDQPP